MAMSRPEGILAPVEGDKLTRRNAAHLLRRAQFGVSAAEILRAEKDGLAATLHRLTTIQEETEDFSFTTRLLRQAAYDTGDISDLRAWWLHRMHYSTNPLEEKLTLFWHNHFATSFAKVRSVPHMAAQNDLFRKEALGSFRRMLHGISKDVAMLIWLDGNANRKRHANENFAREVMELFSLGEGNYTEDDIKQAAKAFTGWHVRNDRFWFNARQHDDGDKSLFGRTGNLDGGDVIDLCLGRPSCAEFLAYKLLRRFVLEQPDKAQVKALAGRIRAHDFAMTLVMRELFSSRLFFSGPARAAIIKSPLDLVLGSARALGGRPNLRRLGSAAARLGQDLFQPPSVKGWEGGRLWINSAMLLQRANFAAELVLKQSMGTIGDLGSNRQNASLGGTTMDHSLTLLLAGGASPTARKQLADFLKNSAGNREQKLRELAHLVMTMPDYQLM